MAELSLLEEDDCPGCFVDGVLLEPLRVALGDAELDPEEQETQQQQQQQQQVGEKQEGNNSGSSNGGRSALAREVGQEQQQRQQVRNVARVPGENTVAKYGLIQGDKELRTL